RAGEEWRWYIEEDAVDHYEDTADAAERGRPVAEVRIAVRRVHRGLDDARRDGVDADAAGGVLEGQRPGRRGQAALGKRRQHRGRAGLRDLCQGGRDVAHVAAVP